MIKSLLFSLLFLIFSCTKEGNFTTEDAFFGNQLPVDGCDWHFSMQKGTDWVSFVASESSKSVTDEFIKNNFKEPNGLRLPVSLTYQLTGTKKEVQCGWGQKQSMEVIDVKSIIKK